jgi:hypothetical protein
MLDCFSGNGADVGIMLKKGTKKGNKKTGFGSEKEYIRKREDIQDATIQPQTH